MAFCADESGESVGGFGTFVGPMPFGGAMNTGDLETCR